MIGQIRITISISVQCREFFIQVQYAVMLPKGDQFPHIGKQLLISVELPPVDPSSLIVLTVTVIITILAVSKLIPRIQERRPLRSKQKTQRILHLFDAQLFDRLSA